MSFFSKLFKSGKSSPASRQTGANSFSSLGFQVVDLRSEEEKQTERNAGRALDAEKERLAQDMFNYLRTHDTGNNMAHYTEFRELFHDRSEAIAENGAYHQGLQQIYYRIRELCSRSGVYFHSGAVDNVFDGGYWQK